MSETDEKAVPTEETTQTPEAEAPGSPAAPPQEAPDGGGAAETHEQTDAPAPAPADERPVAKEAPPPAPTPADPRLIDAELRAAAALAGVPAERIPYAVRMATVDGANADADLGKIAAAAIGKVLADIPELKPAAPAAIGGKGDFKRPPAQPPKDAFVRGLTGN